MFKVSAGCVRAALIVAGLALVTSARADAALISCISQSGEACVGSYMAGATFQSNTWKFYEDPYYYELIYTIEISGVPTTNLSLDVRDIVTNQAGLDGTLASFPGAVCIPTFDAYSCGLFKVQVVSGVESFIDGYGLAISWFVNPNPLSQPPDDGLNTILQARGSSEVFTNQLSGIDYDPSPTPTDPVISGRGDEFSTFGAFRIRTAQVPEPASTMLFGTALLVVLRRAMRTRPR